MPALLLGLAAQGHAQTACTDGQIFDPDFGCVTDPGNGDGDGGGTDPGLIPKLLRFLTPAEGDTFATGTTVAPTGRSSLSLVQTLAQDLTVVLDRSGSMGRPTNVKNSETADTIETCIRWELVARALESLIDILPEQAQLTIVDFASDVRAISTKDFTRSSVINNLAIAGEKSQIPSYIDAVAPSGETRGDLAFRATFNLFNNATYFGGNPSFYTDGSFDREILVLSDGQPTQVPTAWSLNILGFYGDVSAVSLPRNLPGGNAFLRDLALRGGGAVP